MLAKNKRPIFTKLNNSSLLEFEPFINQSCDNDDDDNFDEKESQKEISEKIKDKEIINKKNILKEKMSVMIEAPTLDFNNKSPLNSENDKKSNEESQSSILAVSKTDDTTHLKKENRILKDENSSLQSRIVILEKKLEEAHVRLENFRIINEKLQTELHVKGTVSPQLSSELSPILSKDINEEVHVLEGRSVTSTPKSSKNSHSSRRLDVDLIDDEEKISNENVVPSNDLHDDSIDDDIIRLPSKRNRNNIIDDDCDEKEEKQRKTDDCSEENEQKISVSPLKEKNEKDGSKNEFVVRFKEEKNGEQVSMIKLGDELILTQSELNSFLKSGSGSKFTKKILRRLYTNAELSTRSLSGNPQCKTPDGKNSRTKMTPRKLLFLQKCLRYYLRKNTKLAGSALDDEVNKCNHYITEEIKTVITKMRKDKTNN